MEQPASAYFMEERHDPNETHTLSVLVQNEPGVLARVIGLFSGRGYNIDSLTVSETEHAKHMSLITIVTTGTPMVIQQIKHQLDRIPGTGYKGNDVRADSLLMVASCQLMPHHTCSQLCLLLLGSEQLCLLRGGSASCGPDFSTLQSAPEIPCGFAVMQILAANR
mgnify:CR=1 FL=1